MTARPAVVFVGIRVHASGAGTPVVRGDRAAVTCVAVRKEPAANVAATAAVAVVLIEVLAPRAEPRTTTPRRATAVTRRRASAELANVPTNCILRDAQLLVGNGAVRVVDRATDRPAPQRHDHDYACDSSTHAGLQAEEIARDCLKSSPQGDGRLISVNTQAETLLSWAIAIRGSAAYTPGAVRRPFLGATLDLLRTRGTGRARTSSLPPHEDRVVFRHSVPLPGQRARSHGSPCGAEALHRSNARPPPTSAQSEGPSWPRTSSSSTSTSARPALR